MHYPTLPRFARNVILLAAVAGSIIVVWRGMFHGRPGLSDFAGYYTASTVVARGDSVAQMYDDAWFARRIASLGLSDTTMLLYVNPPPAALVMTPLVSFSPDTAKTIWNLFSLLLAGGVIVLGIRSFHIPPGYYALFTGMIIATVPFLRNLQRGQIYVVMLLLVVLLWRGITERNVWLTSASLAALILLKYFGWIFFGLLIFQKRWKELFVTIGIVSMSTVGLAAWLGPEVYAAHWQRLASSLATYDVAMTHLPTIPAFFGGLFTYHTLYNSAPLAHMPWLGFAFTCLTLLVGIFVTLRKYSTDPDGRLHHTFFALLVASVAFTPLAAEHHYLLMMPALWFLIFSVGLKDGWQSYAGIALLSYAILGWFPGVPAPFDSTLKHLLSYPHLAGAIVLWGALVRRTT